MARQRVWTTVTFWVMDAAGKIVANHPRQYLAVEHAKLIGGTWKRGRY